MKKVLFPVFALPLMAKFPAQAQTLKTHNDSLNYAIGLVTADDMKNRVKDWDGLNRDLLKGSFDAAIDGKTALLQVEDARKMVRALSKELNIKAAEAHKAANVAFLAENGKRPEVKTTTSGLQYEILKKGNGMVSPVDSDWVQVNYHGTLIDGKVFDSSVDRGVPAEFALNRLTAGFKEALKMMHPGDHWKITVPQELAYGERGTPPGQGAVQIKPYSTLIFDLELLKILAPSERPAQPTKPRQFSQPGGAMPSEMPGKPDMKTPPPVRKKD